MHLPFPYTKRHPCAGNQWPALQHSVLWPGRSGKAVRWLGIDQPQNGIQSVAPQQLSLAENDQLPMRDKYIGTLDDSPFYSMIEYNHSGSKNLRLKLSHLDTDLYCIDMANTGEAYHLPEDPQRRGHHIHQHFIL
jgi:hypothetical protein